MVLHQDPSPSESIPPHVARPYIQALNSIRLETQHEEEVERQENEVKGEEEEMEEGVSGEASHFEELAAVMEQVRMAALHM